MALLQVAYLARIRSHDRLNNRSARICGDINVRVSAEALRWRPTDDGPDTIVELRDPWSIPGGGCSAVLDCGPPLRNADGFGSRDLRVTACTVACQRNQPENQQTDERPQHLTRTSSATAGGSERRLKRMCFHNIVRSIRTASGSLERLVRCVFG
jgi:hypothetical protein